MRRPPVIALLVGAAALLLWLLLALAGVRTMPSYLAAWLLLLALPLGALPLVMGLDLARAGLSPLAAALRRMLLLLPPAAFLALPLLFRLSRVYPWRKAAQHGLAATWYAPGFYIIRTVLFLAVWVALGLLFRRPPSGEGRRSVAVAGLVLHVVIGTLAATDWAMSVTPALGSSCFGLLLLAAWSGTALAAATLLLAGRGGEDSAAAAMLLLAAAAAWAFLHFTQFLVVWSADLPAEITWYQQRAAGLGTAAEWLGVIAFVATLALLAPSGTRRHAFVVGAVAALLLLTHAVEMFWLVTPSFRNGFTVSLADLLALLGLGGLAVAALLATRTTGETTHVRL